MTTITLNKKQEERLIRLLNWRIKLDKHVIESPRSLAFVASNAELHKRMDETENKARVSQDICQSILNQLV